MPPLIGQISLFTSDYAPRGWMTCDGSSLFIGDADVLFQLISFTYGGDGAETFNVPDLRSAAPKNCRYCISLFGAYSTNVQEAVIGETFLLPKASQGAKNLVPCNGQSQPVTTYPFLHFFITNRFGGSGNAYNLPNLNSKPPLTGLNYVIATSGDDPNSDLRNRALFVGELLLLPYSQPSGNLLLCDGRQVSVSEHPGLFAVIRNRFGGNDKQFALPDLRANAPANYSYYIAATGVLPPRP